MYQILAWYIVSNNAALLWPHHDHDLDLNAINLWCNSSVDKYGKVAKSLFRSNDGKTISSGEGDAVSPFHGEGVQSIDVEVVLSADGEGVVPVIWDILDREERDWFAGTR
ncbi:hypothetical protein HJFPF1_13501 [Paramyrothecium foliicola]|nr:hypothetical protein HJFPF1_13501 [Paramyrothecium foliicola]